MSRQKIVILSLVIILVDQVLGQQGLLKKNFLMNDAELQTIANATAKQDDRQMLYKFQLIQRQNDRKITMEGKCRRKLLELWSTDDPARFKVFKKLIQVTEDLNNAFTIAQGVKFLKQLQEMGTQREVKLTKIDLIKCIEKSIYGVQYKMIRYSIAQLKREFIAEVQTIKDLKHYPSAVDHLRILQRNLATAKTIEERCRASLEYRWASKNVNLKELYQTVRQIYDNFIRATNLEQAQQLQNRLKLIEKGKRANLEKIKQELNECMNKTKNRDRYQELMEKNK